ncbi:hypothetical protein FOVSG1_013544 [Fusarium oxysporum f. sp. vasinfectum]
MAHDATTTPRPTAHRQSGAAEERREGGPRRHHTGAELSSKSSRFSAGRARHDNNNNTRQQTTPEIPGTDDTLLPSSNNYTTINTSAAFAGVAAHSKAILDEKLEVLRAFSKAFDNTAADFPTGHAHQFAKELAESFMAQSTDTLTGTNNAHASTTIRKTTANRPAPRSENMTYAGRLKTKTSQERRDIRYTERPL